MNFRDKLEAAWRRSDSMLCIGLDPDAALLPDGFGADDVAAFNIAIIEATSDLVCATSPTSLSTKRWVRSVATRPCARRSPPSRRISSRSPTPSAATSNTRPAPTRRRSYDDLGFDAATVNPYWPRLGRAVDRSGPKIRARSSSAARRTPARLTSRTCSRSRAALRPLYEVVAERAKSWDRHGNVGPSSGATYPDDDGLLARALPRHAAPVPGVGAQQGSLEDAVRSSIDAGGGRGLADHASRGVTYASKGADFAAPRHVPPRPNPEIIRRGVRPRCGREDSPQTRHRGRRSLGTEPLHGPCGPKIEGEVAVCSGFAGAVGLRCQQPPHVRRRWSSNALCRGRLPCVATAIGRGVPGLEIKPC